jgi:hypothetical protein
MEGYKFIEEDKLEFIVSEQQFANGDLIRFKPIQLH